jgi:hypothetical protein
MRLDYNGDGQVTQEDLAKGAKDLYQFILAYNYLEKVREIKSTLYSEAIKYMQRDLAEDEDQQDNSPRKAEEEGSGAPRNYNSDELEDGEGEEQPS